MKRIILLLAIVFSFGFAGQSCAEETSFVKSTNTYKRIKAAIDKMRIVDNHEHIRSEKWVLKKGPPDFFKLFLTNYVKSEIGNLGNTFAHDQRYQDESLSVEERWESFKPIYERLKNTGYLRSAKIGIE